MITNDYEPEELQFVLPEVVKDTFPLELTFGNAENEKEIIKAVNEHFNVMFPENELAMRYMDNFEKDEIRKKYCELVEKELPSAEAELLSAKEEAKRLKANAEEALNSVSRQIKDSVSGRAHTPTCVPSYAVACSSVFFFVRINTSQCIVQIIFIT